MSESLWSLGLYGPWNSPGQNSEVGSLSLLQGIVPIQGSNPGPPILQVDSSAAEPQGKPKNNGVGSLSLLQRIFPTQESNQGLLHYRQILYQLSYQGSPMAFVKRQDATFKKFPIMSNGGVETTHRVVKIKYKWIWNYKKMKDKNLFMDLERCFELGSYRGNRTELWA